MTPEPLNRLTKYPRASPRIVLHAPAAAGMGRLVLNVTNPPAIAADVTDCSPTPCWFRFMNQPFWLEFGKMFEVPHDVSTVKLLNDEASSRFTACDLSAGEIGRASCRER